MNERIKELAEQAREEVSNSRIVSGQREMSWFPEAFEKRFAELIVRECVRVMYDNAIERNVPPDINQTPTHYAVAVLEHFGVKE